jgi:hypothetical protein
MTVAGTPARDVASITVDDTEVAVDFGADGTVDATFARAKVKSIRALLGGGDDGLAVTGTGEVPVTISSGSGSDGIGVVGNIGQSGEGDAPTRINTAGGSDHVIAATPGPVTIATGAGVDLVDGGGAGIGQEAVSLGAGNDRFISSMNAFVGTRTDIVDGGAGTDRLEVDGTFSSESIDLSASAGHLDVRHNFLDHIDADGIEDVTYFGFGGLDEDGNGDVVGVSDLSGTDVATFTPNFSATKDGDEPDNSADVLVVRGTDAVDHIVVSGSGSNVTIDGLSPTVTPVWLQPADVLRIDTLGGNDDVDTSGLQQGLVQLQVI